MAGTTRTYLEVSSLAIPEVRLMVPRRHADSRGYFSETFSQRTLSTAGIDFHGVQDNQSFSRAKGTVRGFHFQIPPMAQAKLIRVIRGSVFDVAVDIRRGSPTFGRHTSAVLDAERGEQLFIPAGFAHAFCTLEPDTEVIYKVDEFYSAEHERGFRWDDPDLAIDWPVPVSDATLSEKDQRLPRLKGVNPVFTFDRGMRERA